MAGPFGDPYPETPEQDPLRQVLSALFPTPSVGEQARRGPAGGGSMEFPVPPGVLSQTPEHKVAAEKLAVIQQQDAREAALSKREAGQELATQQARLAHDQLTSVEEARVRQREQALKAMQQADMAVKKRKVAEQRVSTQEATAKSQAKEAGAKVAQAEAERKAAPTAAVHSTLAGVENNGNLSAPGAFSRASYPMDGAAPSEAILAAAQATGDPTLASAAAPAQAPLGAPGGQSVDIGGQRFSAPGQIRSSEFRYEPQYLRTSTGYVGVPTPSYAARSVDNVMTAAEVANLRQRQVESVATQIDTLRQDMPDAPVGQLADYSQALARGDWAAATAAAAKLPTGLHTRALQTQINNAFLEGDKLKMETDLLRWQVRQTAGTASLDPRVMMNLRPGVGGFGVGGGGLLGATGGKTGAFPGGSLGNTAAVALGRGKGDEPNWLALGSYQLQVLDASGGTMMAILPDDRDLEANPIQYVSAGEIIDKYKAVAKAGNRQEQEVAAAALLATGMFVIGPKGENGTRPILVNPASANAANGHAVANYVRNEAQIAADMAAQGVPWQGPLSGSTTSGFREIPKPPPPAVNPRGRPLPPRRMPTAIEALKELSKQIPPGLGDSGPRY